MQRAAAQLYRDLLPKLWLVRPEEPVHQATRPNVATYPQTSAQESLSRCFLEASTGRLTPDPLVWSHTKSLKLQGHSQHRSMRHPTLAGAAAVQQPAQVHVTRKLRAWICTLTFTHAAAQLLQCKPTSKCHVHI